VTRKPRVVTFRMDQATWDRMRELVSYTRYREASSFIREGIDLMLRQEDEQPSECGRRQSCLTSADLYRPSSTSVWRSVRTSQNDFQRPSVRRKRPGGRIYPRACGNALASIWRTEVCYPFSSHLLSRARGGPGTQAVARVRVAGSFSQASATLNTSANPKARVARVSRWT
jgi:Arc/MetJ-type ribon-helix-helix transcriptional regulator